MHRTLKYCVYEKKKIRRLDHSIHLITQFFHNLYTDYNLYLDKPTATPNTSKIFKNHLKSVAEVKNFKIEKNSSGLVVIQTKENTSFQVILAETKAHKCYLACACCGFCIHTFRCSCNSNKFHGEFCIHLHFLSTVRSLLPSFELPINAQISFFMKAGRYSTDPASVDNSSVVLFTANNSAAVLKISAEQSQYPPDPLSNMQHPIDDSTDHITINQDDFIDYDDIGCDTGYEEELLISVQSNEEQFQQAVSNLSSLHTTFGTYIQKLKSSNHSPTEDDISTAEGINSRWCKELPKFSEICGLIELDNCKTSIKEKMLTQQDKQIRLVFNPKTKPGAKKKSKKSLRKPDTFEKMEMEQRLIDGTLTPKKKNLKSQFQKVTTETATVATSTNLSPNSNAAKRGRERPRKISIGLPNLSQTSNQSKKKK